MPNDIPVDGSRIERSIQFFRGAVVLDRPEEGARGILSVRGESNVFLDRPLRYPPANTAGIFNGKTDCMNEGAMANIYAVVARRFPVVDEEAGTVLGLGVFLRKPGVAMRRNQFSEWFVIDQGKLSAIYSSMFYPDQDALVPNWPPYDGNWPVLPAPK